MADEMTVPLLPCGSIDEIAKFYGVLGFEQTHYQVRPNPYIALQREDLQLHFFGLPDFDPEQSYGTCLVFVPDTGDLYQSFAEGMRAAYGKVLASGIPRMTRPRKRKNTGDLAGFSVVDPGGNWIRIFPFPKEGNSSVGETAEGKLARALQNAIVLGDAKGDHRQAARILDGAIAREQDSAPVVDLVEALVYLAELVLRAGDAERAGALLTRVRETALDDSDREKLADALANAQVLEDTLGSGQA
ncbi:VOC family protein [Streptosporangium sp. NPDC000396]|uniref:VOC family protein n=1 Tax=Streptosporangium sp. NPDC000396 TaxID=3366185 RepID=UPI0036968D74